MSRATYVIVGNGVAGTTAAETIRKGDPHGRVVLIGEEPHPLYNRVALPPFLKGEVSEKRVIIKSVQWHADLNIELYLNTRVVGIDMQAKEIYTDRQQVFPFTRLLLATGGRPRMLRVPGSENATNILPFQTLNETKVLIASATAGKRAVVVGGSYIAYELAEGFRSRGLDVTWLIRGPRFLHRVIDEAGGELVDAIARTHGVVTLYKEEVSHVETVDDQVTHVVTTGGRRLPADVVGCGVGIELNTELAVAAGAAVNKGILTDDRLRTTQPNVFAAGDVAEFYDSVLGGRHTMGTWNNAASHGKMAGANMLGAEQPYVSVPTYTTGLFDSKVAVMGATPELTSDIVGYSRLDWEKRHYQRLFYLGDRLVGAVLIGDMSPRRRLLQAIRAGATAKPEEMFTI